MPQEFQAAHPLSEDWPQMSSWNGGITRQQLEWLRGELAAAEAAGERVVVASHHQLGEGAARATHMAWNWREVQQVGGAVGVRCLAAWRCCVPLVAAGCKHVLPLLCVERAGASQELWYVTLAA